MRSFLLFSVLLLSACYRQDIRTFPVRLPELETLEEANAVRGSLLDRNRMMPTAPLYVEIRIDLEQKTLFVTYDAQAQSQKNIEHEIAALGFTANDIPGNPAALEALRKRL